MGVPRSKSYEIITRFDSSVRISRLGYVRWSACCKCALSPFEDIHFQDKPSVSGVVLLPAAITRRKKKKNNFYCSSLLRDEHVTYKSGLLHIMPVCDISQIMPTLVNLPTNHCTVCKGLLTGSLLTAHMSFGPGPAMCFIAVFLKALCGG